MLQKSRLALLFFALPVSLLIGAVSVFTSWAAPAPDSAAKTGASLVAALEAESFTQLAALLAPGAVIRVPYGFDGSTDPEKIFRAPMNVYFAAAFLRFSQIKFENVQITPSADGTKVFIEARGNLVIASNGRNYRNLYIWRLDLDESGKIKGGDEYANPVTIAIAFDEKLGAGAPTRTLERSGL